MAKMRTSTPRKLTTNKLSKENLYAKKNACLSSEASSVLQTLQNAKDDELKELSCHQP